MSSSTTGATHNPVSGAPATADPNTAQGSSGAAFGAAPVAPGLGAGGGTNASTEGIKDTVRSGVDSAQETGDAIRGKGNDDFAKPPPEVEAQSEGNIVKRGTDELKRGLDAFKKA